jgi:hypothetical protein
LLAVFLDSTSPESDSAFAFLTNLLREDRSKRRNDIVFAPRNGDARGGGGDPVLLNKVALAIKEKQAAIERIADLEGRNRVLEYENSVLRKQAASTPIGKKVVHELKKHLADEQKKRKHAKRVVMPRVEYPPETKAEALRLRRERHYTYNQIALVLGLREEQVRGFFRDAKLTGFQDAEPNEFGLTGLKFQVFEVLRDGKKHEPIDFTKVIPGLNEENLGAQCRDLRKPPFRWKIIRYKTSRAWQLTLDNDGKPLQEVHLGRRLPELEEYDD